MLVVEMVAPILAESYSGNGTVCDVARRHGLASGQLLSWRRQRRQPIGHAAFSRLPEIVRDKPAKQKLKTRRYRAEGFTCARPQKINAIVKAEMARDVQVFAAS